MIFLNFSHKKITPCKIVCIGRNYVEHIKELNNEVPTEPVYFIKPNSAISEEIIYKDGLHYEGEISFLIKDKKIVGVGFGFDLTFRDIQSKLKSKGLSWERCKAFKGSAVFSDFVKIDDINELEVEVIKNGAVAQRGGIELMIYKPDFLVKDSDEIFGLDNFDIIMSGTPKGVGKIEKEDEFIGRIYKNGEVLIEKKWKVKNGK